MKFIGTKENINRGINIAGHLATRASNLPILNNVLLRVQGGGLEVLSTNLEIGIKTKVRGKAEMDGGFSVRAKVLLDYINLLPSGNVEFSVSNDQMLVACENFKTSLKGQKSEEFPIIPQIQGDSQIKIPLNKLKKTLDSVLFAVSLDETRPEIGGVLVWFNENGLRLVATDSYRLSEVTTDLIQSSTEYKIIIPLKALQEVSRITSLSEGVEMVEIYFDENQVMFGLGGTFVTSRLIDGNYPDYEQIIPSAVQTKIKISRDNLIQAVKAAAPFTKTGINDVKLNFEPDIKKLTLTASNVQVGSQEIILPIEGSGGKIIVTFNYKYLLDGLLAVKGDTVIIELGLNSTPVILRDPKEKDYLYLIMPIKQ